MHRESFLLEYIISITRDVLEYIVSITKFKVISFISFLIHSFINEFIHLYFSSINYTECQALGQVEVSVWIRLSLCHYSYIVTNPVFFFFFF